MKRIPIAAALAVLTVSTALAGTTAVPVEVWTGAAHDGLTQKLVDALDRAISKDPMFRLAPGNTAGSFKILIPSNVAWKSEPGGLALTATAEFSTDGKALGETVVTCTDTSFDVCADGIVAAAKGVLSRRAATHSST